MEKRRLGFGVVGFGYWGPNLARNVAENPECRLTHVCDLSPDRLRQAREKYPEATLTDDFSRVLGDPELDAVIIATPISTHFNLARRALSSGKHVLVEKPIAASAEQAKELLRLARSKELTLMVGHTFKFSPPVNKIKELVDSGELGRVHYISSSRINLGLHQNDHSVIWDLAPHDFSILFYWLDEDPVNINAFGKGCIRGDMPDVAFINLSFPSGVVAEVQLSWLSPIKLRRTIIVGSKKMLLYDDTENIEKVKVFDRGVNMKDPDSFGEFQLSYRSGDIVSPHLDSYEPLAALTNHFVDCIRKGREPITGGQDGLRVVSALETADQSLQDHLTGREESPWVVFRAQN